MTKSILYNERHDVTKRVYKKVHYLIRRIYGRYEGEPISTEGIQHLVSRVIFEIEQEKPDLSDEDLYLLACKRCKKELWGRESDTAEFHKLKRRIPSVARQKIFSSKYTMYKGHEFSHVTFIEDTEKDKFNLLYQIISNLCGHEAAILFLLHKGYGISLRKLSKELFNINEEPELMRNVLRIHRLLDTVAEVVREYINVSRVGQQLFNLEG